MKRSNVFILKQTMAKIIFIWYIHCQLEIVFTYYENDNIERISGGDDKRRQSVFHCLSDETQAQVMEYAKPLTFMAKDAKYSHV